MTAEEVLIQLINQGIVHKIGDEYFVTSMASKVTANMPTPSSIILNGEEVAYRTYPKDIREASPDNKASALMNYCKIPYMNQNGKAYPLRSADKVCKEKVLRIMKDQSIDPDILLTAVIDYYETMEYPKGFNKFVKDGDILEIYRYYKNGNKLTSEEIPDNLLWRQ